PAIALCGALEALRSTAPVIRRHLPARALVVTRCCPVVTTEASPSARRRRSGPGRPGAGGAIEASTVQLSGAGPVVTVEASPSTRSRRSGPNRPGGATGCPAGAAVPLSRIALTAIEPPATQLSGAGPGRSTELAARRSAAIEPAPHCRTRVANA